MLKKKKNWKAPSNCASRAFMTTTVPAGETWHLREIYLHLFTSIYLLISQRLSYYLKVAMHRHVFSLFSIFRDEATIKLLWSSSKQKDRSFCRSSCNSRGDLIQFFLLQAEKVVVTLPKDEFIFCLVKIDSFNPP